jgi:hypothetical protein
MSSFIRRIERALKRNENGTPNYMGRGSKMGVKNPKDACLLARKVREDKKKT